MEKHTQMEVEVKVPVKDPLAMRENIVNAGAVMARERHFESNTLFDYADRSLSAAGCLLRTRELPEGALLTFKGKVVPHEKFKTRPEAETLCADSPSVKSILHSLGLRPFFRYQKYREEYSLFEALICLDELPFGFYLEVEGDPNSITLVTQKLQLDSGTFSKRSYAAIYSEICREKGVPFGDILFKNENGQRD
jgi:adenylate cyclase, class 2